MTIHRRGDLEGAEAFAAWRPKETIKTRAKEEILAFIQINLASRASEELFLDTNLNGVAGDFATATRLALSYVGVYGMDGTISSYLGYAMAGGGTNINPTAVKDVPQRAEAILQSQLKAVKRLLQNHSEALIAVAEALIEDDELVAEDLKRIIDEADARRVTRLVMSEFEDVLSNGNGHKNGHGNGHTLVASTSNSESSHDEITRIIESSISPIDEAGGGISMSNPAPFSDTEGPTLFMGG